MFARLQSREIWENHSEWVNLNGEYLDDDVRTRLKRCESLVSSPAEEIESDCTARSVYSASIVDLVDSNFLVLPVLPYEGPMRAWNGSELADFRAESFRLMAPASLSGCPQVVISHALDEGQTVAVGLLGPPGSDFELLSVASGLEQNLA